MGRLYTVSIVGQAITTAINLFEVDAVLVPFKLHSVQFAQGTDFGDSNAESLAIKIQRTTDAIVETAGLEEALDGGDGVANAACAVNQAVSSGGLAILHTTVWNIAQEFIYLPPPEHRPVCKIGESIVVELVTAPGSSLAISGTLIFEETGN